MDDLADMAGMPGTTAGAYVWTCSCRAGGHTTQRGIDSAWAVLVADVGRHLRGRGNEHHAIHYGPAAGTVTLDRAPVPLVWRPGDDR